ncbi:hypothetical protein PAERUG_E5_London_17_VIM_2_12_12_02907 [Pseudomonas aeruginosa]|nr:hypothetical protein PAERUG_E5_London_17_VIM_2_12_12_02907 [Pseudomonas aeruginosa]
MQRLARRLGQFDDEALLAEVGEGAVDHLGEDLLGDVGADEVEDDDVLADPVEDFRAVENQLEVALDLAVDLALHRLEGLAGEHVGDPFAVFPLAVDAQVRGEHDQRLGEVHAIAAPGGEHAVVEDLQELVEDPGVGFLDLVEEHHAEGFFADRVGQFAADVVADVAGRRADQALVGMLGAELGHVEADVGALVAEQQAGDGLRQLGLADPGGPGEEGHAARAVALAAGADPGHRALDDVQHVGHRVLLALDPAADDLVGLADALAVDLQPGVFGDADLVAAHGVGDAFHGQAFHARQLDDGVEIEE